MKKGTNIIKNAVELFDTRNYSFSFWEEHCKEEGIEYNEDKIDWEYISDCLSMDWDYIKEVLSEKFSDCNIIISGTLGLWHGAPQIENVLCDNIADALSECINNMDDFVISYDNWGIYVKAMHHDGTNSFTLSPIYKRFNISEEVLSRFDPQKAYYKRHYIRRIYSIW